MYRVHAGPLWFNSSLLLETGGGKALDRHGAEDDTLVKTPIDPLYPVFSSLNGRFVPYGRTEVCNGNVFVCIFLACARIDTTETW